MTISLSDAGKRYNRDWIFRHFTYTFSSGKRYAITGPNGSGKSTLLQAIGGAIGLNEGSLSYQKKADSTRYTGEEIYRELSIVAPYLETIEEMTVTEFLSFHQSFKPLLPDCSVEQVVAAVGLEKAAHKQIRFYSSGMKQRVKLAQAIFSDVPLVLFDEPCTNLDKTGIQLYQQLVAERCQDRIVIVSSNDEAEFGFCEERVSITDYK